MGDLNRRFCGLATVAVCGHDAQVADSDDTEAPAAPDVPALVDDAAPFKLVTAEGRTLGGGNLGPGW
jgi:hypothetical protein